jgi:PTS system mannose-specific IIC component
VGLLALAAVAGLAAVERKGFLQAMLSRPIVLGPLAGLACGDAASGLLVGAPLELLWLGAVNLGAAVPLHESIGTAAIAGGAALAGQRLGAPGPALAALATAVCLPLSAIGRRADALVERANERLADRAARRLAAGDEAGAVRCNLLGLASPFAISAILAPLGAAAAGALAPAVLRAAPRLSQPLALAFVAFSAFACAAGAKALRARRARKAYLGAAAAGLALLVLGGSLAP